ncbi:MAG: ATP-binding cassette domain-containing protein [Planctomycetota bacterium]
MLIGAPDVLLLDEPTNHLDIESILWLEGYLKASPLAAILLTSHDRDFIDRVVSRIVEIDAGELVSYTGNYAFFENAKAGRAAQSEAAFARQQAMLRKEERFIERFEKHAAKAAQVQSRVKKLEKIEKIEPPKRRELVPFGIPPTAALGQRRGDPQGHLQGLRRTRAIYEHFDFEIKRGERWAVMGANGAGKTTLLKMIVGSTQADDGEVKLGASLKLGYFAQSALEILDPSLTIWQQIDQAFPIATIPSKRALLGSSTSPPTRSTSPFACFPAANACA